MENWARTYRVRLTAAASSGLQLFSEPLKSQIMEKVKGKSMHPEKTPTVSVQKKNYVSCVVRQLKWSTSLPLMRACMESLTQTTPNSPITLLHSPRSQSLQGPLFQHFPSLVHFSFPWMLYPCQEKGGVSQSLASVHIDRLTAPVAI